MFHLQIYVFLAVNIRKACILVFLLRYLENSDCRFYVFLYTVLIACKYHNYAFVRIIVAFVRIMIVPHPPSGN